MPLSITSRGHTPLTVTHGPVKAVVIRLLPADVQCLWHLLGDEGSLNSLDDVRVQQRGATGGEGTWPKDGKVACMLIAIHVLFEAQSIQ